ncbi:MAG: peptidoglycan DD-metalloendopeptidase family protein [Rhodothermales bacterium]|nr:peptidoglycan DD-metalloendopeptidase family protein [Rhodothermales bacterium]
MKPTYSTLLILCFCAILTPMDLVGQESEDRQATEQRINELRSILEKDQQRLSQTRNEQKSAVSKLRDIERQVKIRQELATNYEKQQNDLLAEQDSLKASLEVIEEDVNRLKSEYQGRATHAYKYGRQHDIALILAASSINEMLVRIRYLKRFSEQRKAKLTTIKDASHLLEERRSELQRTYQRNEALIEAARGEQARLAELKGERRKVISNLNSRERALAATIEERKETVAALESKIQQLIAAEDARQAGMSAAERSQLAVLTGSFEDNAGRLPWPSAGVVTQPYGEIVNPELGTRTPNPGIVIGTEPAAAVSAVFEGRVISVDIIPDYGTYLIIEHGSYHTVYSNFSLLYVSRGDQVTAGQLIGRAGTESEPKGAGLFFALFKEGNGIDPQPWLAAK